MYGVNTSVPKTLVRYIVRYEAEKSGGALAGVLYDILDTPVSPELLPAKENGEIAQKTEDLVGPYELHDFFLYHMMLVSRKDIQTCKIRLRRGLYRRYNTSLAENVRQTLLHPAVQTLLYARRTEGRNRDALPARGSAYAVRRVVRRVDEGA